MSWFLSEGVERHHWKMLCQDTFHPPQPKLERNQDSPPCEIWINIPWTIKPLLEESLLKATLNFEVYTESQYLHTCWIIQASLFKLSRPAVVPYSMQVSGRPLTQMCILVSIIQKRHQSPTVINKVPVTLLIPGKTFETHLEASVPATPTSTCGLPLQCQVEDTSSARENV